MIAAQKMASIAIAKELVQVLVRDEVTLNRLNLGQIARRHSYRFCAHSRRCTRRNLSRYRRYPYFEMNALSRS